jgi:hypothetical protein
MWCPYKITVMCFHPSDQTNPIIIIFICGNLSSSSKHLACYFHSKLIGNIESWAIGNLSAHTCVMGDYTVLLLAHICNATAWLVWLSPCDQTDTNIVISNVVILALVLALLVTAYCYNQLAVSPWSGCDWLWLLLNTFLTFELSVSLKWNLQLCYRWQVFFWFMQPGPENHNCYPDEHYVQTFLHVCPMFTVTYIFCMLFYPFLEMD